MTKPDELYPPFLTRFESDSSMDLHEAKWKETFLTYVILDLSNVWYKRLWRKFNGEESWKTYRDVEKLLEKYLQKVKDSGDF